MACQLSYGQRFVTGTGMTDGEGIERLWSYLRGFRKITKEMSLNNRQDLLTEAMLHHTAKTVYSLGGRMIARLTKCEKVIEENEKIINDILTELEESEEAVVQWQTEWKSQCQTQGRKNATLTVEEQYVDNLNNIELKKELLKSADTDLKKDLEKNIERLTKTCVSLKKKISANISLHEEPGISLLYSLKEKKKHFSLKKLKDMATERQYLSSCMKKYADGQGIGLRISNQFSQVVSKMKKELDIYNSYQDPPIELKSLLLPTSPLYNQLHSVNLTEQQQKAVEAKSLLSHAKEEKDILYKEMNVYSKYLVNQSSEILNNISILEGDNSRTAIGMRQYLLCKHYNLECMVNYLKGLFKNYIELQIPQTVHDLLKIDISATSLLDINAEELHTILSEIREFEQVTSEDNIGDSDCENDCDVENDFD